MEMTNDTFNYQNGFSVAGDDVIEEMGFQYEGIKITDPGAFQGIDQVGGREGKKAAFRAQHTGSRETPAGQENTYEVEVGVVTEDGDFESLDSYGMTVLGEPSAPEGVMDNEGFQNAEALAHRAVNQFYDNMAGDGVDYVETGVNPTGQYQASMSMFGGGTQELHFPLDEEEEETGNGLAGIDRV